jgi:hypothetical protein
LPISIFSNIFPRIKGRSENRRRYCYWFQLGLWPKKKGKYNFLTAALDAAIWGAVLALGEGRESIYLVEPTGPIANDPDLTDKKFPGNAMKSYRSRYPLRIVGEVMDWQGHAPEQLKRMKGNLSFLKKLEIEAIED